MRDNDLTRSHRELLHEVLAPYARRFARVGLFGSRATGRARPESDIDLVVYGAEDPDLADRLYTLFDESLLPVKVDVVDYDRLQYLPLKQHIDQVMRVVFERRDFIADAETT